MGQSKLGGGLGGRSPSPCHLMLSPGSYCQNQVVLQDTRLAPETCLVVWTIVPTPHTERVAIGHCRGRGEALSWPGGGQLPDLMKFGENSKEVKTWS